MPRPVEQFPSRQSFDLLSRLLLLRPLNGTAPLPASAAALASELRNLNFEEFEDLLTLANSNHVIVRGLEVFLELTQGMDTACFAWAERTLEAERQRIETAIEFLSTICRAFKEEGYDVAVIKSLDHWPDLGSDLDLYTNASWDNVWKLMRRFDAQIAPRSWGDQLAHKWNFLIPELPEAVEVHMGRLGQTGEHVSFAASLIKRSKLALVSDHTFCVPSSSDRVIISTLQRMYRHFYFRLCDIVDSAALVESGGIDYEDLRSSASAIGIWEGVATYLAIVSNYVKRYRGTGLELPQIAIAAAQFSGDEVQYARGFLRVPIMPQSARLYGSQLADTVARGELRSSARLSLLPWLATAAVIGQKFTGSDKGIW